MPSKQSWLEANPISYFMLVWKFFSLKWKTNFKRKLIKYCLKSLPWTGENGKLLLHIPEYNCSKILCTYSLNSFNLCGYLNSIKTLPEITQISHKNPLHTWKYYTTCYTRKANKRLIELITHADQKTLFVGMEYKLWKETYSAVQSHYLGLTRLLSGLKWLSCSHEILEDNCSKRPSTYSNSLCLCGCLLKFWTESRFCLKSLKYPTKNPPHTWKSLT